MNDPCVQGRSIAPGHAACEGHSTCQLNPLGHLTDAQLVTRLEALADSARATDHPYPTQQLQEALAEAVRRPTLSTEAIGRAIA